MNNLNERIDLKKAYLKGERRAFSDISIKLFEEVEDCFKKFKTEVKYDGEVIRFNDKNIEEIINKISKIKENQEKILEINGIKNNICFRGRCIPTSKA